VVVGVQSLSSSATLSDDRAVRVARSGTNAEKTSYRVIVRPYLLDVSHRQHLNVLMHR